MIRTVEGEVLDNRAWTNVHHRREQRVIRDDAGVSLLVREGLILLLQGLLEPIYRLSLDPTMAKSSP